tara:strand:+ start:1375 stop:2010 length:636 start_codon:yes stop_codon:yes gene_type:complete
MSVAILIGCGGERANDIVRACHEQFDNIINIGASKIDETKFTKATNHQIEWSRLDLNTVNSICKEIDSVDFMFFNQNQSGLSPKDFSTNIGQLEILKLIKSWTSGHWTSCQLPYVMIKTLEKKFTPKIKIGWMLSEFIDYQYKDVEKHPDYSGNKFTNYLIMKSFSNSFKCFGIAPYFDSSAIYDIITDICEEKINCEGQVIDDFTIDENK